MRKTKYIGIAAAALMLVSGVTPGFSTGLFSADNTAVTVSAAYIGTGSVGGKFSCYIDNDTFLYLSVIDENSKTASVSGSGLGKESTYIYIPDTATFHGVEYKITEIAANAFEGQTNLSYVTGMRNVTKIGDRAFYNCTSLTDFSVSGYDRSGKNRIETIGNEAFYNCSFLERATLNCASNIGYRAFGNCSSLGYLFIQNVSSLGSNAFEHCWSLTEVNMEGAPLKNISSYAFNDCGMLQKLTLPEGLEMIGDYAFDGCRHLQTLYIPESVRNIQSYAFRYCRDLSTAMIPDNVQYIGDYAFYGCDSLTFFVCKNPNAGIGYQAIGYDYNRFYSGPKKDFVVWGKGGNIQNYASNNGFTYHDCSEAPGIAKKKFADYQWKAVNTASNWADPATGKRFYLDGHRKYVSESNQNEQFSGSCYGLAVVSAMTYNGYIKVDDYCPGYSTIRSIPTGKNMPSLTKSFVNTIWPQHAAFSSDFTVSASNFYDKKMVKYAEYITYGADAAVCVITPEFLGSSHAIVCYGLEFKENAGDRNSNKQWDNMDARFLVYDVNDTSTAMTECYYVNFSTGNWGSSQLFGAYSKYIGFRYSPSRNPNYSFSMIYNHNNMIKFNDGSQIITGANLMYDILSSAK